MCRTTTIDSRAATHAEAQQCRGACHTVTDDDARRTMHPAHDLDFPEVPLPSKRVLEVAGETALRDLVRRHHDLLRASTIGNLLSADDAMYAAAIDKIGEFVIESCGGAPTYTQKHGKPCMRIRHFPFTIDEAGRDIWLNCLWRALKESALPEEIREEYWNWMEAFSIRMINRRTTRGQPRRYPFNAVDACMRHAVFAVCPR